ncbi:MAG: hypothetical protein GY882_11580 [Actinomycetia bacterium]|nr:hypothetical protein [Actinomycetes bacterium]MCP4843487.1 hypothetical protein [Actinomycetes bacterium]
MTNYITLAQEFGTTDAAREGVASFLDTTAGGLLQTLLAIAGFIFVLTSVIAVVKEISRGNVGKGLMRVGLTLLVVPFLFAPALLINVIEWASGLVGDLFGSATEITG